MKIIDRLPFADRPHLVTVRAEAVGVYRNQIVVWISIDDVLRPLPTILDTRHGHNLSIAQEMVRCPIESDRGVGDRTSAHRPIRGCRAVASKRAWSGGATGLQLLPGDAAGYFRLRGGGCAAPTADWIEGDGRQQAEASDRRGSAAGDAENEGVALAWRVREVQPPLFAGRSINRTYRNSGPHGSPPGLAKFGGSVPLPSNNSSHSSTGRLLARLSDAGNRRRGERVLPCEQDVDGVSVSDLELAGVNADHGADRCSVATG
jgi:hypothetical protein